MSNPLISVITVCLNSEKTICRTIESVLNQSYYVYEYIIIDGDSKDGTVKLLKKYENKFNKTKIIFKWLSEPDKGIYNAINKGIRMAHGNIIGIINSNDFYEEEAIKKVFKESLKYPNIGIFYGYLRCLQNEHDFLIYRYNYNYYLDNLNTGYFAAAQHPTCFIKKTVYDHIGLYDDKFKIAADYDFLIRAKLKGVNFHAIDTIITNFSLDGISVTAPENVKLKERYDVLYKNKLITEKEYKNHIKYVNYTTFKEIKKYFYKKLFDLI
jgi:glycosyltransferase involved in cell wall biosynthesis